MKPRKIMVHLELKSNVEMKDLRAKVNWQVMLNRSCWRFRITPFLPAKVHIFEEPWAHKNEVHQVSVHVVKEGK